VQGPASAVTLTEVASARVAADEEPLLERARRGDERAFSALVAPYRSELHAHCYRMLASFHDAEDALQDALVRAWRGLDGFEGRSSVRAWLYKIATNAALSLARRRSRRELPMSYGPSAPSGERPGAPLAEAMWLGPYPDQWLGPRIADSPEARYEQQEGLELAFIAALQQLPPLQRAALILREVLGFSAQEVAEQVGTSVPAVTSALQRARAATERRVPLQSQQATLRSLGDERTRELVGAYVAALERADTPALVGMLAEDVAWAMPPLPTWYQGREAVGEFLTQVGFNERWRHLQTRANGQLALGCYTLDPVTGRWVASALDLLRLEGDKIAESDYFLTNELLRRWGSEGALVGAELFPLFGLPAELEFQDELR
jgi:RNA polymerase sigma-70 factor (ECF subfamily)